MTRTKLSIVLSLWASLAAAQERPRSIDSSLTCVGAQLISMPDTSQLEISNVVLSSYESRSMSSINVRNRSAKSIESITVLVEYMGDDSRHVETAVYYATTHRFKDDLLQVQGGWGVRKLTEPLRPNASLQLTSVSDLVALNCPAKAEVTKVAIRFDDISTWSFSSPKWMTDPIFREASVETRTFPETLPFTFLATVELSIAGRAAVVETSSSNAQIGEWLQRQLDKWLIVPGDRGLAAKDAEELTMLVRLHGKLGEISRGDWKQLSTAKSSLLVVDVAPTTMSGGQSTATIGGMLASQHAAKDEY